MRAAFWILALFALAVAAALVTGGNHASLSIFWAPWRVDVSFNFALLVLVLGFVVLHLALKALATLFRLPQQAQQWRNQQRERALHLSFLDALSQLMSGRFVRARKAALDALGQEEALRRNGIRLPQSDQIRALSHLMAAEAAHALQDKGTRDQHIAQSLVERLDERSTRTPPATLEAVQLRSARWTLDDRDPQGALERLSQLPQGAARRTLALRIRLKAARLARRNALALETARLLAKHRAFSAEAAQGIVRSLGHECLADAHDAQQLERAWASLDASERAMPDLAMFAAQRLLQLAPEQANARATSRQWLQPVWERYASLSASQKVRLVQGLENSLYIADEAQSSDNAAWLVRIEAAQQKAPSDANLQYLYGMGCIQRQLWGKAQMLLEQATRSLQDEGLRRKAWRALAALAQQRGDTQASNAALREAAMVGANDERRTLNHHSIG